MAPLNTHTAQRLDESVRTESVTTEADRTSPTARHGAPRRRVGLRSAPSSRVAYVLGVATVCSLALVDLLSADPAANATASSVSPSVAVAAALGIEGSGIDDPAMEEPQLLEQLAVSRSERDAEQAAAAASQAQAEEAALAVKAQAEAEAKAAADAAAEAAADAAAAAAEAAAAVETASADEAGATTQAGAAAAAPGAPAASVAASVIAKINNSSGPIKAVAQNAANSVVSNVPGAAGITIGGTRASAADPGGHPSGLALDFMCSGSLGDAIAEYHIAHWDELGVEYIIWEQRMLSSPGGSWKAMADRGSATANHYDHVHVNYRG